MSQINAPTVLITGAARRIGAEITRHFHNHQFNVIIHYHHSQFDAENLALQLNSIRHDSVVTVRADLNDFEGIHTLAKQAINYFGRIDLLVNNASSFTPTPIGEAEERHWDSIFNSNAKAPFFLSQALSPELKKQSGSIINMVDVYGERPLENHTLYCMAKSALRMMTQSLAKELGPNVRVNGIAPGAILWPEQGEIPSKQKEILDKTCLHKLGQIDDIIKTIEFLYNNSYVTGQIINVDGGRSIHI